MKRVNLLTIKKRRLTFQQTGKFGSLQHWTSNSKHKIWRVTIAIQRGPPARNLFRSSIQTTSEQNIIRLRSPGECSGLLVEFVFLCGCYFQAKTAPVPKDGKGDGLQAQVAVSYYG